MNTRYKNTHFLVLAIVGVAFFQACMLGPRYEKPEIEIPDQFIYAEAQEDSVINLRWWELFGDTQLIRFVEEGLVNNRDLLVAAARIEEARAILGYTRADVWPTLGFQGAAQRSNYLLGIPGDPMNLFSVAPSLQWELDFWGKFRRANQAAKAELIASEFGYRSIQIGLISEIVTAYYQLMDYENRLMVSQRTLETRQHSVDIIQQRFDYGIVAEIDLNQSQIQEAIAAASIPVYERAVTQTENALSILLGGFPGEIHLNDSILNQVTMPEIPVGLTSDLLYRRPDVMAQEQKLVAQTARIGVAQAQRLPAISISGMLGVASTEITSITSSDAVVWSLSGAILGPIFQFNKNKRRVEAERFKTEQVLHEYEKTILNAFREVEDALIENSTYESELEAVKKQIKAAENASKLANMRYDKGVTSFLEVLEADRYLFDAELRESEVVQKRLNSFVKLYKALGGGWITAEEEQAAMEEEQQD